MTAISRVPRGVEHDLVPVFARGHAEEGQEGIEEVLEVHIFLVADDLLIIQLDRRAVPLLEVDLVEQKAEQDTEHVVTQKDEAGGVDQTRQRENEGADQLLEAFQALDQFHDTQHAENSENLHDLGYETEVEVFQQEFINDEFDHAGDDHSDIQLIPGIVQIHRQFHAENLQLGFDEKRCREEIVQVLQGFLVGGGDIVMLKGEHDDIGQDQQHDEGFEVIVLHKIEDHPSVLVFGSLVHRKVDFFLVNEFLLLTRVPWRSRAANLWSGFSRHFSPGPGGNSDSLWPQRD